MIVVSNIYKMVTIATALTRSEFTDNVFCGWISRTNAGVPITSNDQHVPSRDAINDVLQLFIKIVYGFNS